MTYGPDDGRGGGDGGDKGRGGVNADATGDGKDTAEEADADATAEEKRLALEDGQVEPNVEDDVDALLRKKGLTKALKTGAQGPAQPPPADKAPAKKAKAPAAPKKGAKGSPPAAKAKTSSKPAVTVKCQLAFPGKPTKPRDTITSHDFQIGTDMASKAWRIRHHSFKGQKTAVWNKDATTAWDRVLLIINVTTDQ